MKLEVNNKTNDIQEKVKKYINEHPGLYNEDEEGFIMESAAYGISDRLIKHKLIHELYDELGLLPDHKNLYLDFLEMLERSNPDYRNKTIVSYCSGKLPRLEERIAKEMEEGKGKIIVFGPEISEDIKDTDKMTIIRKGLSVNDDSIDWENIGLLIGLKLGVNSETLLKIVRKYGIDFAIGFSSGVTDYFQSTDEWIHSEIIYAKNTVRNNNMGNLVKIDNQKSYYKYPFIFSCRRVPTYYCMFNSDVTVYNEEDSKNNAMGNFFRVK